MNETINVKVLAFDVFGTVVDWCGSVAREVEKLLPDIDGGDFARAWRSGYAPAMARVMSGEREWALLDTLHREILDDLLSVFAIDTLSETEKIHLNKVWHRLDGWPDSVKGMMCLKTHYTICSLSNGNLGLLTNMAKHAGLPWDCILSAEVFRAYKPDPATYLGVARVFDAEPNEVMLVAAHHNDLAAARSCGLKTAYIERPLEFGIGHEKDVSPRSDNTVHAKNIVDLAGQIAC